MLKKPCVYCGKQDSSTMDHVPPRSIFPSPLPNDVQMVTAPACLTCHDLNQKDDTTIRNILTSTRESEKHPAVIGSLAGKRDRSLVRSLQHKGGDFNQLIQTMKIVDVKTSAGIHLGKQWAFDLDNSIIDRFVERLSRALLSYAFAQTYFQGAFSWKMNLEIPDIIYQEIEQFGCLGSICDIFAYGVTRLKEGTPAWIVANFYGTIEFLIQVSRIK